MSIFDKVKEKLVGHADKVEDAANKGVDKAADIAKEKTGGTYDKYVDTAAEKAKEATDKIDGQPG
ncbi:antitoxin [Acrocarpospora sp. B8E8]|uniref:antitoxin n=1 Tax=Acrocarpospora sp. B8E8 TaxID=3153572 RepID=UPI00325C8ADD